MAPTPPVKMSYPCNECNFEAQSARQLSRHKAVTHVENALKCVLCPFVTAYQTNLLRHRREVHGICGSKGNKSCKFCGFLSEDNETLIRHQLEVHRDILKSAQVKFAKELVSAGGEETASSNLSDNNYASKYELQSYSEHNDQQLKVKREALNAGGNQEDDDEDDKNFWKEGFMDDGPNLFMNLASLQHQREQNDNNATNWYNSSGQTSPPSHENSISEFVSSRSSTPKTSIKKMAIPAVASNDDLPATRIRRQYTCNDCGFRTINPREFLYHRRDEHGQRLKIVECPYCVYACQYVQKLQRHLLLVHKLETSMTPPPEVSQNASVSKSNKSKSVPQTKAAQQLQNKPNIQQIPKLNLKASPVSQQNIVPKIKVKLPTATSPAMAISEVSLSASSPSKVKSVLPSKPMTGTKRKMALQRQMSANQKRSNDKSLFAKKYHKCQTCGYMTNVHYLYKKHMKYHSAPKIKCEMCDFESPYSWNVDRHVRSHFSNGLFKCTKCSFACDKKQALTVHMTQHHRDRANANEDQQQPQQQQQQQHQQQVEQTPIIANPNEPENYEEREVDQDNGEEGLETNEESIANLFTQSLEEGVQRSSNLGSATNQNMSRAPTTFVRQMDGKIVAKQGLLKKCKYCPFQTDTFAKLQKHETSYHPEKKFQCPLCEIKFENLVWLQRHLTHMHQEDSQANNIVNILDLLNPKRKRNKPMPSTSTPMSQNISDSSTEKSSAKQTSVGYKKKQTVTDKSSTQCQVCGYQTRWISELEKHMRVHTKERPFACPYCSFKSKWKGDLNRHIQKYHSRLPMPDLNLMEQQIQSDSTQVHSENAMDYTIGLTPQSISQTEFNSELRSDNYENDASILSGEVEYEDDFIDENIDEIKMDDKPLPDDYEERPLVFDDLSDDNADNEEEVEDDDNDNELQIDFDDRELVIPTDIASTSESPNEMTKSGKVKMYRCSYCDFTCSTASRFHVHFVQHLNTKPFQCSVCGHRSNWEWDVTKHIKMKSQRDAKHVNAKAMLVHESGKRDYSKYNKYVVWINQKDAIANNSSTTKIDFRAKRARLEQNDMEYDENDINQPVEADYEEDNNYNSADPESIVITPDICFAVQGEDNDSCSAGVVDYNQGFNQSLQPNVPYNSTSATTPDDSKQLQCYYCDFKHKESKVMVSHLSSHAGMKPYRCRRCGFDSNWREVVVRHCASRHGSTAEDVEQRFRCTVTKSMCRIIDESNVAKTANTSHLPSAVQAFQESHQSVRISGFKGSFICDLCPFRAEKAFHMDFHAKRHQPSSGPFKCPHCPYWVNAKKSLVKHMLLHANTEETNNDNQQHENGVDLESFVKNNNVNNDDLDESENELVIYEGEDNTNNQNYYNQMNFNIPARQSASVSKNKCDKCPFIAGTKTQLLYHKQFHRPNRNASYSCTMCTYSVSYLHLLNQHMKVHYQNSGEIQPQVNYTDYSPEDSLVDEERDESDIPFTFVQIGNNKRKLFQCRFCPTTSKRRTYIYVHEKMHSQNTNENFKCSQCNFATRDSTVFLAHLNTHKINTTNDTKPINQTSNKSEVSDINKSLQIPLKQTSFSSPSVSVIDVNNIRHGNRRMFSYVCPDCPAAFKSPGDLKIHSAFHGAEHPHPCPYCNYRAKNKPQLCKHLYVHTAEYIAKRANSYPDGTKLLIGDAVDHMKRDLRSPLKESASDEQEKRENTIAFQTQLAATSLLKKSPESQSSFRPEASPQSSPPWSAIARELNGGNLPKRPALFTSGSRTPREQMILLELTESKAYLDKIRTGGKHRFIYRCSHCPAVFMKVNTLTFHVGMHGNEDPNKCKLCSYSSTSADNLSIHQQLHNYQSYASVSHSVYNHRCTRCPAAFSKRSRLEKHLTLHGLDAKWKCDKCDYAVHYAATLVKHRACHQLNPNFTIISSENEDNQSDTSEMSNTCLSNVSNVCNIFKKPQLPSPLPSPPPIQSPDKSEDKIFYCCDRCPYVHNRRDAVQNHQKRHDQQLRNVRDGKQCPYCDYTCLQPSYLRDHIQWHFEPSHDRRPSLFTYFNELEIWKLNEIEENDEKKPLDSGEEKEMLFKDLGSNLNVRQRFEPYEDDEELFEFFNCIENLVSETDEEEDELPVTNDGTNIC